MNESYLPNISFHSQAIPVDYLTFNMAQPEWGAQFLFTGHVRANNQGRIVTQLAYEIHQELAQTIITNICLTAKQKWEEKSGIRVVHAFGILNVGDISVLLQVLTPHRKEAFSMGEYIIHEIKHKAPIWKKEYYTDGQTHWVQGHSLCH